MADRRWWRLARIACINRPIVFSTVHSHILPDLHYLYDVSSQVPSKTVAKPIENLRTRHVLPDDTKFNEAADNTPNPEIFDPAADLDTFRNVDPTRFEWVKPDEIQAGEVTCGFLKAPFGWPAGSKTGFKDTARQTEYPIAQVCKFYDMCK